MPGLIVEKGSGSSGGSEASYDSNETYSTLAEPMAIIGMGCRWPGDSKSPSELWNFLQDKKSAHGDFPKDRVNVDAFYHPNGSRPGSFYTKGGCFLNDDPRKFDPTFFGIHPREATGVDPAQRKLLEAVYEAFESSGTPLDKLSGSKTGCFVGNFNYDHQLMQYRDAEYPEPYAVTGGGITILSNRVNFVFNLHGPSLTLDTACSSSMVALHLACIAIQTGECTAAVVGGSNLILTPECQIFSTNLGAVSPTSVCHTFDAAADGYARADGIGALYIKKLSEAIKDGDPIRAVIRATATNANGRTGGMSHPSPEGQERVIRRAYERAGNLDPRMTGYFECHGTGTPVGDPLEVTAVGRVFSSTRSSSDPLLIGSIKTNLGHSEPSSGIAGIMKAVLALEHGIIPPTVGLVNPNPNIDFNGSKVKVVTESTAWPDLPVRRASVNSFGYGGSNAHTILESAESFVTGFKRAVRKSIASAQEQKDIQRARMGLARRSKYLAVFSAHDEQALRRVIAGVQKVGDDWDIRDLTYTLACRRTHFLNRAYSVVDDGAIGKALESTPSFHKKQGTQIPSIAFVFTGQGAQWATMSKELMYSFPSFLRTIRYLDRVLEETCEPPNYYWSLEAILREPSETSQINNARFSQPVCTAIQIAIVDLLRSWNVNPVAVVGHSSGEIAAAYTAGHITAEEAIIIAYFRGVVVSTNTSDGAMLAAGLSYEKALSYLHGLEDKVVVACHNSPGSVTLSGDVNAVEKVKASLDKEKIFVRLLLTSGNAYHSHHMKLLGNEYQAMLDENLPANTEAPRRNGSENIKFISSVSGKEQVRKSVDAAYWRRNLESPVLFDEAVQELLRTVPVELMVEIGPHSALAGPLKQIFQKLAGEGIKAPEYLSTLQRKQNAEENLLDLAGKLFTRGYPLNLEKVNSPEPLATNRKQSAYQPNVITDLPTYPWNHENILYRENRWTKEWRLRNHMRHDILGSLIPGGSKGSPMWRNILKIKDLPWLVDHKLGTDVVFPSTGFLAMALEAVTQQHENNGKSAKDIQSYQLRNVSLDNALLIPEEDAGVETLLNLNPTVLNNSTSSDKWFDFVISSVVPGEEGSTFSDHVRGQIGVNFNKGSSPEPRCLIPDDIAKLHKKSVRHAHWYERFAEFGLGYGPIFQGMTNIAVAKSVAEAVISLHPTKGKMEGESRYVIHPAALDAAMQLSLVAAHDGQAGAFTKGYMPIAFEEIEFWPANEDATKVHTLAHGQRRGARGVYADVCLTAEGRVMMNAKNLLLISSEQMLAPEIADRHPYTRMVWKPDANTLDTNAVEQLFPLVNVDEDAIIPRLNNLALHQLVQFHNQHREFFDTEEKQKEKHLQRFLDWTVYKIEAAKNGTLIGITDAQTVLNYSLEERAKIIEKLSIKLNEISSESRLMCHLYNHLPAIFRGEITGIQVALQDNLLLDNYEYGQVYREGNKRLAQIVDLIAHQRPNMKILEVGAGTGSATREILAALKSEQIWKRYDEYVFTDTTPSFFAAAEERFKSSRDLLYKAFDMEKTATAQGLQQEYDLVLASNVIHATSNIKDTLLNIRSLLKEGGKLALLELTQPQLSAGLVLGTFSDYWKGDYDVAFPRNDGPFLHKEMWKQVLKETGFGGVDYFLDDYTPNRSATVVVATATGLSTIPAVLSTPIELTIVDRHEPTSFTLKLQNALQQKGHIVHLTSLSNITINPKDRTIILAELLEPLFPSIKETEFKALQKVFATVHSALWVTNAGLLVGKSPQFAMISGILRGLKTETRDLKLSTLDLDVDLQAVDNIADLIAKYEDETANGSTDTEFRQKDGQIYISRLYPDEELNEEATSKVVEEQSTDMVPYESVKNISFRLDTDKPGILSGLYFRPDSTYKATLRDDVVEIDVKAAGLNMKDLAVATGKHHSNTFSDECAGIVRRIGASVTNLKIGDHVAVQAFQNFGNMVQTKAIFCQKVNESAKFADLASMPIVFCTAIYGLIDLARLSAGETILIQSATGGVGLAAIQIARYCGAEIYATVGNEEKKAELLRRDYGIKEDNIFMTHDKTTPQRILDATNNNGVDVILSGARGEAMHESWRCIAPFGRFIEIGRTEVLENGKLNMDVFRRNATFSSFDLESMSQLRPDIIARLMSKTFQLYQNGVIAPVDPVTTYHISKIEEAMMYFSKGVHIGKVVLTYEDQDTPIKYRAARTMTTFDAHASYLLVGCLGGLGRSYSDWMVKRGARKLIYLSRSGTDSKEAKLFVEDLERRHVEVQVVRGDVAKREDVRRAVKSATSPIHGVVQGSLALNDALFDNLTLDQFHSTVQPRLQGTLNLHHELDQAPLDFFVMWSSWTTMFGTATQSNYMATSSFMDAFARYRHGQGLPATSLALSQVLGVGIVSYMPEYQAAMIRNGFYGNDEEEFLEFCEASVRPRSKTASWTHDPLTTGHLLVGIEPQGLSKVDKTYPLKEMVWNDDPRFSLLLQATDQLSKGGQGGSSSATEETSGSVIDRVRERIARLMYVPVEDVDVKLSVSDYGIDSMIAAELRNWFFSVYKVNVSLLTLLSQSMTIEKLADKITAEMAT